MAVMTPTEGRGTVEERPAADTVHSGFRWTVDGSGEQYVSDGQVWILDAANELWTLAYGEDIKVGYRIRRQARVGEQMQQAGFLLVGHPGVEVTEFCEVLERREFSCTVSCIAVRPNGEQIPVYLHTHELVQVASDVPR